jgi:hypothetical protein
LPYSDVEIGCPEPPQSGLLTDADEIRVECEQDDEMRVVLNLFTECAGCLELVNLTQSFAALRRRFEISQRL